MLLEIRKPANILLFQCHQYFLKNPLFPPLPEAHVQHKEVKSFDFCFWKQPKKVQLKIYWVYQVDSPLFCRCSYEKMGSPKIQLQSRMPLNSVPAKRAQLRPGACTPSHTAKQIPHDQVST